MLLVIVCGGAFVIAVIFALYVRGVRERYIGQIQSLKIQTRRKENELTDVKNDFTIRKENVRLLERQLESLRFNAERDQSRAAAEAAEGEERTALSVLLHMGRVTQADVERAEDFKGKSGSEQTIEEVLVLLDVVSPEEVKNARATAKK